MRIAFSILVAIVCICVATVIAAGAAFAGKRPLFSWVFVLFGIGLPSFILGTLGIAAMGRKN